MHMVSLDFFSAPTPCLAAGSLAVWSWTLCAVVVTLVLIQTLIVRRYVELLDGAAPGGLGDDGPLPRAAIVLSLRGADPSLAGVLHSLLDQDHPDYLLAVVLDSEADPAREIVEAVAATAPPGRLSIDVLADPPRTCSLKCSALAQVVEALPADVEHVAFIDGDTRPYRSWLRDLVVRLESPGVGAVTGNRWYTPRDTGHGGLTRHFWNAGAVVQVWFNGIPWAGSLALRRDTIRETGIIASWRKALSVDGTVGRCLGRHGKVVHFVPESMMLNDEQVDRNAFQTWLVRQLVAARSTNTGWSVVLCHAGLMALCMAGPPLLALAAVAGGDWSAGAGCLTALAAYWAGCLNSAAMIDRGVRDVATRQGDPPTPVPAIPLTRRLCAVADAHVTHLTALWHASRCRTVQWRGIRYEILAPEDVRMLAYERFSSRLAKPGASII